MRCHVPFSSLCLVLFNMAKPVQPWAALYTNTQRHTHRHKKTPIKNSQHTLSLHPFSFIVLLRKENSSRIAESDSIRYDLNHLVPAFQLVGVIENTWLKKTGLFYDRLNSNIHPVLQDISFNCPALQDLWLSVSCLEVSRSTGLHGWAELLLSGSMV